MLQRYRMDLCYDGSAFFGWQIQPREISVQETIETALRKLCRDEKIAVVGCGRTDTGVHAKHYVLHFDTEKLLDCESLVYKLNRFLKIHIAVEQLVLCNNDFHARFDAKQRTYRYFIHQRKDPFAQKFSLYHPADLNLREMQKAANFLLGKQDFTSFSKLHTDVKTNICDISEAKFVVDGPDSFYFEISADRFLRNMVRAITGTLLDVGIGKINAEDVQKIIAEKDRGKAGKSVAAHALFLWKIEY